MGSLPSPPSHPRAPWRGQAGARLAFAGALLGAPACALSQAPQPDASSLEAGVVLGSIQKPYLGVDRQTTLLPMVRYENRYLHLLGTTLQIKLPGLRLGDRQVLRFSLLGRYDASAGYDADDAPALAGLEDRKGGFWAGARVEWQAGSSRLHADWTHDVSSHSKGQRLNLGVDRTWRLGQHTRLTPRLVATWHDRKFGDYYYGVRAHEVAPGRPHHEGGSGWSAEAGLQASYRVGARHTFLMDVSVQRLSAAAKDSPLVERSSGNRIFFGYTYRFQ